MKRYLNMYIISTLNQTGQKRSKKHIVIKGYCELNGSSKADQEDGIIHILDHIKRPKAGFVKYRKRQLILLS